MDTRALALIKRHPSWVLLGLPALTVVLGMESVRVLVSLAFWVLRDRSQWTAQEVGLLGFLVFVTAFLAGPLWRLLGPRVMLVITVGGLGLLRLVMQAWTGDPVGDLVLAVGAVVLFVLALPTLLARIRGRGESWQRHFVLGLLLGIPLDVTLHGAFGTYDRSWDSGVAALVVTLVVVVVLWLALAATLALAGDEEREADRDRGGAPWRLALPWLALGPFLFLQLLIFENVARFTALTGWSLPPAFAWVAFGQAAGIGAAAWVLHRGRRPQLPLATVAGIVLVVVLAVPTGGSALSVILLLAGQVTVAALLALVVMVASDGSARGGMAPTTVAHGVGMVLLVALTFAYYAVYDISLPVPNSVLPPLAGAIVGLAAVAATRTPPGAPAPARVAWLPVQIALALVIVPLVWFVTWEGPSASPGEGYPVRVMTYNLHNGFNTRGYLGMEAIAQVIEAQQPDVLALQEVSRGWLVNGSLDMATWLSQRLEMPYMYGPTVESQWGNALLTRYPVLDWGTVDLPPRDLLLTRGFTWARLDVGEGNEILVINTHYHHPREDTPIRVQQSQVVLDFWAGRERTVFLGDLNTRPGEGPVRMLADAGLADALDLAGVEPGYTTPPADPQQRIDYIWASGDLAVPEADVPRSLASDHLPVVAVVEPMR